MQQGQSPPRAVLALGVSGLVAAWLFHTAATGWAGTLPAGLSRNAAAERLSAVAADAVSGFVTENGTVGPSAGPSRSPITPGAAPTDPAIKAAMAEIADLAETFARLAEATSDAAERATRTTLAQNYAETAATLRQRAAASEMRIADLPPGIEAVLDREAVVINRSVVGRRPPPAAGETIRLTQVLLDLPQQAGPSAARRQWVRLHAARLAEIEPRAAKDLRPYLTRYWLLQDAYLALHLRTALPALAAEGLEAGLSVPALEAAFEELLAEVRATSGVAGYALVKDWSAYRIQVVDLSAAIATGAVLALDRLFSPPEAPPVAERTPVDEAQPNDLQARLVALEGTLAARTSEIEQARARLLALQADLAALAKRDEERLAAVQALTAHVEAGRQALDRATAAADARHDEVTRRVAAAEARMANLQDELGSVTGTLETAAQDLDALHTRVDALRQAQADSTEGVAQQAAQPTERLSTVERKIRSLTEAAERVDGMVQRQATLSAEIEALQVTLAAQAETLAQLDEQGTAALALGAVVDAAHQRLQGLESKAQTAEGQRQALAEGLAGLADGLAEQKAATGTLRSRATAIADRLDRLTTRIDEAASSAALGAVQGALVTLERRVAEHDKSLGDAAQRLAALGGSIKRFEPQVREQQSRIESLLNTVGRQAESLARIERDLTRGLARLDDLDARLARKADREELAAGPAAAQQAAERQISGAAAESGRISGLERRTADLDAATGELNERLSASVERTATDIADLRIRIEAADQRAGAARWAAVLALSIAGVSAMVALILAGRLIWRRRATEVAQPPDEAQIPTAEKEGPVPAAAEPRIDGSKVSGPPEEELAASAQKANAQKTKLESLDALLAELAFAVHADREKAASIKRDLAAAQKAVQAQVAEATRNAAELKNLRREMAALAKEQDDLKANAEAVHADFANLEAARRKMRQIGSNIETLRREVRNTCRALLAAIESAKKLPSAAAESRAGGPAEDLETGATAVAKKRPVQSAQKKRGRLASGEPDNVPRPPPGVGPDDALRRGAIDAIKRADLKSFVREFAELTGLSQPRISLMLFTGDGRDLAAACRATGIEKAHFAALFVIARKSSSVSREALVDELARAIRSFERLPPVEAAAHLKDWQTATDIDLPAVRVDR